ncbi:Multiple PDZ domain proteinlike, partial [Caligus rogercresseyi]
LGPQPPNSNNSNQSGSSPSTKNLSSRNGVESESRLPNNISSTAPSSSTTSSVKGGIKHIKLHKEEGHSLGFSVVGLRSEFKGELGIYVQEIQPEGLAGLDGRLSEGDQILAIDGKSLDSNMSHQQAISILQRAQNSVELLLCVVEVIQLTNNGSGLGFGIIGGQKKGGVADVDGRLCAGDFILQINEHWLQGVGSEQVAAVLRGTGNTVRLVDRKGTMGPFRFCPFPLWKTERSWKAFF